MEVSAETANSTRTPKRDGYLDLPHYFMATALLAAMRSKDPALQVGACIVNKENRIIGTGYNGMPKGCSDDEFPWKKNTGSALDSKSLYVCHAEMNALVNTYSADVRDCIIYVSLFPCKECAKMIIQSGIKEVIYLSDKKAEKDKYKTSKIMLDAAEVKCSQFEPVHNKIEIDFEAVNWDEELSNLQIK